VLFSRVVYYPTRCRVADVVINIWTYQSAYSEALIADIGAAN